MYTHRPTVDRQVYRHRDKPTNHDHQRENITASSAGRLLRFNFYLPPLEPEDP